MFLSLQEKLYLCAHENRDSFVRNNLTCAGVKPQQLASCFLCGLMRSTCLLTPSECNKAVK